MTDVIRDTDVGTTFKVAMEKNVEGVISVFDISSYTTKEIEFLNPSNVVTSENATFVTDGTDGLLTFTTNDNSIFLGKGGLWHYRGHISKINTDFRNYNWLPFKVKLTGE